MVNRRSIGKRRQRPRVRKHSSNVISASKIQPSRNRVQRMPPSLSMLSNICDFWVRSEYQKSAVEGSSVLSFNYNVINALDELGMSKLFSQCRIKRVNFWWIPRNSINDEGLSTMAVVDYGTLAITHQSFAVISACPGSDTRRVYQTLACAWFPTEPQDRNWLQMSNASAFCSIYVATSRTAPATGFKSNLVGVVLADAHVCLRGSNGPSLSEFNLISRVQRVTV